MFGECFDVAAPRDGLMFTTSGRLYEILFDRSHRPFVELLIIPFDEKSTTKITSPNQTLTVNQTDAKVKQLRKRGPSNESLDLRPTKVTNRHIRNDEKQSCTSLVTFVSLPHELHWEIFDAIESIEDALSLGMANRCLWDIAKYKLDMHYRSLFGALANKKLVCFREDTKQGDYPPGLFSDAEAEHLMQQTFGTMINEDAGESDDHEGVLNGPFRPYDFTQRLVAAEATFDLEDEPARLRQHFRDNGVSDDDAYKSVSPEWDVNFEKYIPEDKVWILRNLTTKQFVRSETVALRPEFMHGPHIDHFGFGEILLSRICWASDGDFGEARPGTVFKGPWAGHCFDIVAISNHDEMFCDGTEWTDISDQVVMETYFLWESTLGPTWIEDITEVP